MQASGTICANTLNFQRHSRILCTALLELLAVD